MTFTLITQNVYGVAGFNASRRLQEICRILVLHDVDVIAFQEVHSYRLLKKMIDCLRGQYRYVYRLRGTIGPLNGLVVFSKQRFSRVHHVSFAKACRRHWKGMALGGVHKGALVLERDDLTLIVAHASPNKGWDWSVGNPSEINQSKQIDMLIERITACRTSVILCGDLNVDYGSPLYWRLINEAGLTDGFSGRPTFVSRHGSQHCIDHVLVRGFKPANPAILMPGRIRPATALGATGLSDHAPLLLELA